MSSETRKGELYIVSQAILWSLYSVFAVISFRLLPPVFTVALTTSVAFFFFVAVATYKKSWRTMHLEKNILDASIAAVLLACSFSLAFIGLQYTTPGNAGLISLLDFFFVYIFFNLIKKEHITNTELLGAIFILVGAAIVFLPDVMQHATVNKGDLIMVLVSMFTPFINYFQKRAREGSRSETVLLVRTAIGAPIMFLISFLLGETATTAHILEALPLILISGIFVFGYSKILWLDGILRIPMTKAIALSEIVPLFTLFFAFILLNQTPSLFQVLSFIPLFIGVLLLTRKSKK